MIDKELKKEKEEILQFLYKKIDSVKDDKTLKIIAENILKVNELLDIYDTKLENFLSTITQFFTAKEKSKIKKLLEDIFDKYDKRDNSGSLVYSESNRAQIQNLIKIINNECDKNFWDRFKIVLGIGS